MPADLSEQIQRFEEKYAENPDSLVFARLADLYRKAGDADRGLSLLREGLERHPDYLSAHIVRGRCLRDLGRREEAEEAFERVLDQDEQNLVALRSLAEISRERGEVEEAERRYEELLALDPHNEEARSALDELVEGGAREASPPAEGEDAGPGRQAEVDEEEPWWRSDEPPEGEPEEPAASGDPDAPGEAAPAGADQDDVFSLAGPEEGDEGDAGAGGTEPPGEPGAAEAAAPEAGPPGEGPGAGPGDAAPEGSGGAGDDAPPGDPAPSEGVDGREPGGAPGPSPGAEEPGRPAPPEPASREEAEFLGLAGEEGDGPGGPEDAVDGELPAEEELTERIEEIADTADADVPPVPEEGDGDAQDLLTETLADLYETQGFYGEAVEMYEELLEERPDDEELRARLEAARSAMEDAEAGQETDTSAARPEVGPGPGTASGGEAPSDDDLTRGREPTSVRAHLRALLRGEAGADGSVPEGPDPGP